MVNSGTPKPSILRLLALLKPRQGKYFAGMAAQVTVTTIERMMIAYLAKILIDAFTSGNSAKFNATMLDMVLFYIGFVVVAPFAFNLWRSSIYEGTANIRATVFKHLQRLPLGYHELHHSGDALSILTNDVSAAEKAYQDDLYALVSATIQGLAAAVFMLILNWQLALLTFLGSVIPLIVNTLFAKPLRKIGQNVQAHLGELSERMTDLLAGFQVIRTFNLGEWILTRFDQANDQVLEQSLKRVHTESNLASANSFSGIFGLFIPLIAGGYLVINGQTTFGVLIALIQLNNQIGTFAFTIGGTVSRIQAALAAADRILGLLDSPLEPESYAEVGRKPCAPTRLLDAQLEPQSTALRQEKNLSIEFKDVLFGYNGDQNILNSLSFQVQPGQVVAFAGPSGGGKSTFFKLLLGCYPVRQGMIRVSGAPIHAYRLRDLRNLFAYVPQDAYLFSGTIMENIRYGKPEASEAEVTRAAQAAFAHDFISEFPAGYQTVVGERGARLSGGQRQRIAIARALLKDAPILLLDEATSALDSESEHEVHQALEVLMKGRTTLVIAHRFSTILNADQIYVIDGGKIMEQGKHEDLLALKGIYAGLFELQFAQNNRIDPAGLAR